jgi:hypothetical protein
MVSMATCCVPLPFLAVLASLCGAAVDQEIEFFGPFAPTCSKTGNYTNGSQFKKNLEQLLSTLSSAAASNDWFQTSTIGTGADKVFGLIMCYADSNTTECLDCLTLAPAGITTVCSGSRNVSAIYRSCLLRYSDTHFFGDEVTYGIDSPQCPHLDLLALRDGHGYDGPGAVPADGRAQEKGR